MYEKISPADALRRIAKNLDEGRPRYQGLYDNEGKEFHNSNVFEYVAENSYIKKPTRTITLELPMPLTELPENASKVYWAHIEGYGILVNCRKTKIERLLERSMLYETEKDAEVVFKTLNAAFSIENIVEGE